MPILYAERLNVMPKEFEGKFLSFILDKCREAVSNRIFAACIYGLPPSKALKKFGTLNVLVIVKDFGERVRGYRKRVNGIELKIIASDKEIFEKDVKNEFLGGFLSDALLTIYTPLLNTEYLRKHELFVKIRTLRAIIENLILEYPEFCREMLIKPEYFIYELARRKVKIFPLFRHGVSLFFREIVREERLEPILERFRLSFKKLEENDVIEILDGYIKIKLSFIDRLKKQKLKTFFRKIQKKALTTILDLIPEASGPLIFEDLTVKGLKNSEKYLYIPTSIGLVSLAERTSVDDFVSKLTPDAKISRIEFKEIGGILNSVYLLKIKFEDESEKCVVVKKFKDWLGLKWFPITLWTLGTKSFAVLGESRLEKEYAINKFLRSKGFNVPEILYVSPKKGLIFQEYIEGVPSVKIVKQILLDKREDLTQNLELIRRIGAEIAKVHAYNVCIGDSKPENILIMHDNRIFFVDLEQASRGGDKAWDVAEFLYYSGHYALITSPIEAVKKLTKSFIRGYLDAGGDEKIIKEAGSAKYTKVFSIFALPHVILTISNLCKKLGEE